MSLIGTLEQFGLANVLQRIEGHAKTGLLLIRQGSQWIELYIRDGQLLCVGPLRTNATLGERLVHDRIISQTVFHETSLVLGDANGSESRTARTLMELGYVSRDELRNWTIHNTAAVLKVLLSWEAGEIYFDDDTPPPADRLLVSMSLSFLLTTAQAPESHAAKPYGSSVSYMVPPVSQMSPEPVAKPVMPVPTRTPILPVAQPRPEEMGMHTPTTPRTPATRSPDVARVPTLMSASQFLDDASFATPSFATSFPSTEAFVPVFAAEPETPSFANLSPAMTDSALSFADANPSFIDPMPSFADANPMFSDAAPVANESGFFSLLGDDAPVAGSAPALQPVPVMNPMPPKRIDTSFLLPEMVLLPTDLSAYRDQNPQIQITPDQWCILTHADGRTPLLSICQELSTNPEIVCPVVGELIAEGLISAALPENITATEPSPVARELVASGLGNGYVAPGYASAAASPWSASLPAVPASELGAAAYGMPPTGLVATESQWGNGGNGATFVPGRGWVTSPQPMQPLQTSGPLVSPGGLYVPLGNDY